MGERVPGISSDGTTEGACPAAGATTGAPADLTWLLHRGAQRLRSALDIVAREEGLASGRDWIVLTALADGPRRTQLALGSDLGLDKTTMTSLLDRLEAAGLVVRRLDPQDRRARIPEVTASGRAVARRVSAGRDRIESELLSAFSADEQALLRHLLTRLATGEAGDCLAEAGGSCM